MTSLFKHTIEVFKHGQIWGGWEVTAPDGTRYRCEVPYSSASYAEKDAKHHIEERELNNGWAYIDVLPRPLTQLEAGQLPLL